MRHREENSDAEIIVQYNDTELGRWQLSPKLETLRRRFVVPTAVFNRNTLGTFSFEAVGQSNVDFGLEGISLRDARHLGDFKGFVDRCSTVTLVGWAIGGNIPVSLVASLEGVPLPALFKNVDRPDLQLNGLPLDAGFEILPTKPIAAGSKVEVRFPNGRHLNGSPCEIPERSAQTPK